MDERQREIERVDEIAKEWWSKVPEKSLTEFLINRGVGTAHRFKICECKGEKYSFNGCVMTKIDCKKCDGSGIIKILYQPNKGSENGRTKQSKTSRGSHLGEGHQT